VSRDHPPHARIDLPPLSADYALTLVQLLELAVDALWRTHGERMHELLALRAVARARPPRAVELVVGPPARVSAETFGTHAAARGGEHSAARDLPVSFCAQCGAAATRRSR